MANQNDWRSKLPFLEASNGVSRTVMGTDYQFFPVSAGKLFKLKKLAGPIGKLLDSLQKNTNSTSSKISRMNETETEGAVETIETNAIDPKLEEQMALRRQFAITELIEALTDDRNIAAVGDLLIDSIKETFPRGDAGNPSGAEFIQSLPLPALADMVIGVVEANKEVFGPLGGKIKDEIEQRMKTSLTPDPEPEPEPKDAEEGESNHPQPTNPATLGSISPTQSNGSQQEVTQSNGS